MKKYLDEALYEYSKSNCYPFHMPGHKRNDCPKALYNPYQIDITEIDGFDNLHHAEGILKEAQKRAAALYGAEESFYLVNGSTAGLLSAVSACTSRNGTLLMARNCHKAVYEQYGILYPIVRTRGKRTVCLLYKKAGSMQGTLEIHAVSSVD